MNVGIGIYSRLEYYGIYEFNYLLHFKLLNENEEYEKCFPLKCFKYRHKIVIPDFEYEYMNFEEYKTKVSGIGISVESIKTDEKKEYYLIVLKIIRHLFKIPCLSVYYKKENSNDLIKLSVTSAIKLIENFGNIVLLIKYHKNNFRRFVELIHYYVHSVLKDNLKIFSIEFVKYNNFIHIPQMGEFKFSTLEYGILGLYKHFKITYNQFDDKYWKQYI